MFLKSLKDAQPGQRVHFIYYGGSNPGSSRIVDIESMDHDRIHGMDVSKGENRQFLYEHATLVQVLDFPVEDEPEEVVRQTRTQRTVESFMETRNRLVNMIDGLTGEDLASMAAEIEGHNNARFDSDNGQVVLEQEVTIPYFIRTDDEMGKAGVHVVNEQGDILSIHVNDGMVVVGSELATPEELLERLTSHLGG